MAILTPDERRRITLPSDVLDDAAQRFVAIKTREGILLKPLPRDPIAALEREGKKLAGVSVKELRRRAQEDALKDVG